METSLHTVGICEMPRGPFVGCRSSSSTSGSWGFGGAEVGQSWVETPATY